MEAMTRDEPVGMPPMHRTQQRTVDMLKGYFV